MKKRTFTVLVTASLAAAVLWGCGANQTGAPAAASRTAETAGQAEQTAAPASTEATGQAKQTAAPAFTEARTETAGEDIAQIPDLTGHTLMIYCGAGMTKPFQEIADAFKEATGCEMNVTFANAGQIQSQITTSEEGDLFIAGSADELKPVEAYVEEKKDLVKHVPVLAVQSGNPKGIMGLGDLTGDGVSLIMGEVDSTPIGKIAKKAMTAAGIFDKVHIEATTATAPQMSTALAAGEADAAIVWKENCDVKGVEIVDTKDLDPYIKTVPAASLNCSGDKAALKDFNNYLNTDTARSIWIKYGYEIME